MVFFILFGAVELLGVDVVQMPCRSLFSQLIAVARCHLLHQRNRFIRFAVRKFISEHKRCPRSFGECQEVGMIGIQLSPERKLVLRSLRQKRGPRALNKGCSVSPCIPSPAAVSKRAVMCLPSLVVIRSGKATFAGERRSAKNATHTICPRRIQLRPMWRFVAFLGRLGVQFTTGTYLLYNTGDPEPGIHRVSYADSARWVSKTYKNKHRHWCSGPLISGMLLSWVVLLLPLMTVDSVVLGCSGNANVWADGRILRLIDISLVGA